MKKIFSFICITLMCVSLNSCYAIYAMCDDYCDDYNGICYYCKSTPSRCICKHKYDEIVRRDEIRRYKLSNKPITYRYYTVPVHDPTKPIGTKIQMNNPKRHPKPTPHPHCHNHPKNYHNHKHNRR